MRRRRYKKTNKKHSKEQRVEHLTINLKDLIATHFHSTFNNNYMHEIDYGGRGTTKTSKNALKIVLGMLEDPRAEAIVFREDYTHHRNSTYKALLRVMNMIGMRNGIDYKTFLAPLRIEFSTGNSIYFGLMSDYEKMKGYEPTEGNYFCFVWFFEATEFKGGKLYIEQAKATYVRGNKPYFKTLTEFNTSDNRNNYTFDLLEELKDDEDTIIRFSTYLDLTEWERINWLGKATMQIIENLKKLNYKMYEFVYLGIPRVLKGACHPHFDRDKHVKPLDFEPTEISVGIDFGVADAVSGQIAYYQGVERVHKGKLYYHSNRKSDIEKTIYDYDVEVYEALEELANKYKQVIEVNVDSANKVFIQLLEDRAITSDYIVIKAVSKTKIKRDTTTSIIQERIDFKNILISAGVYTVEPDNKELITELESSKYDDKTGKRLDTIANTVDTLDADDYSLRDNIEHLIDNVLEK